MSVKEAIQNQHSLELLALGDKSQTETKVPDGVVLCTKKAQVSQDCHETSFRSFMLDKSRRLGFERGGKRHNLGHLPNEPSLSITENGLPEHFT